MGSMGSMYRTLARVAVLASLAVLVVVPAEASIPPSIVKIAAAGDSISEPCLTASGWCGELSATLATQGIHAEISALASGGKRCRWIAERIHAFLAEKQPDILLLNCGTNDNEPTVEYCYGEPCTTWAWRVIVEAARAAGVHVGVAFIGYTDQDAPDARGGNKLRLETTNDLLYSQIVKYEVPWDLALANFQVVPGNPDYLPDGVHPIGPLGSRTYAQIWHAAVAAKSWGWPATGTTPCGMYGRRIGYPVPTHIPCPK